MGSFKRENPGDPSQWAQMGMLGGGTGLAANYLSGQPLMQWGGGIKGAGGLGQFLTGRGPVGDLGPQIPTSGLFGTGGKFGLGQGTIADLASNLSGGKELSPIEIVNSADYKRMVAAGVDPDIAYEEVKSKSGKSSRLLKGLLGIGGTLGLANLIGDPEDITVDASKIRTAPIDTGQVFSPTTPVTVDTGYDVPITEYPYAAEGGIIGYESGGSTDRYILFKGSLRPLTPMPATAEKLKELGDRDYKQGTHYDIVPLKIILDQKKDGGIMDLRGGGFSQGPGTGTSDSIPAMLSDGEFVMTADAVRGAGGGNRREGARKMYQMMDRLEGAA